MTYDDPELRIPDTFLNYTRLRLLVEEAQASSNNTPLTDRELVLIANLMARESQRIQLNLKRKATFIRVIEYKFETTRENRFDALAQLLDLNREYITRYPSHIARLARYLLGETTEYEHKLLNWDDLACDYPNLFFGGDSC